MSVSSRSLWRIIGFSQLILLLSFGYFAVVVQAAELPPLGGGKVIDMERANSFYPFILYGNAYYIIASLQD